VQFGILRYADILKVKHFTSFTPRIYSLISPSCFTASVKSPYSAYHFSTRFMNIF